MIPSSAIQKVDDRNVVFVKIGDTDFQARHVQLAGPGEGWAEVTSGLRQGETVAAHGSFFLKSTMLRSRIGLEE